jgi:type I restriction enzyme, S subunit
MGKQTTNLASLSLSKLKSLPVPLMSEREADEIANCVEDVMSVTGRFTAELSVQEASSKSLRQSVLRAAFSGNLVEQDPTDEPASALLARIAAERAAIVRPTRRTARSRL